MPTSGQFPQEQDYQELKKNADALYKWTNSAAGTSNVNLAGNDIKTLEDLKADVIQIATDAANLQTYLTYDAPSDKRMVDDTSQQIGTQGEVTQDPDPTKNKRYTYTATGWVENPEQPARAAEVEAALISSESAYGAATESKLSFIIPYRKKDRTDNVWQRADASGKILELIDYQGGRADVGRQASGVGSTMYIYPFRNPTDKRGYLLADKNGGVIIGAPQIIIPVEPAPLMFGAVHLTYTASSKEFSMVWQFSPTFMARAVFRPNGFNNLFNFRAFYLAPLGDINDANWTQVVSTGSDMFPPMIIEAVNNPDDPVGSVIYTGGNHGSNGAAGGVQTARMISFQAWVDGKALTGNESDFKAYARQWSARWVNELFAFNTIAQERYVFQQTFDSIFYAGGFSYFHGGRAYEDIFLRADNGPQLFQNGYTTNHYYDGDPRARTLLSDAGSSGVKTENPSWAMVFGGPNGLHGTWMDRTFEAGDGRWVRGSAGFYRNGNNGKSYSAVVAGGGAPYPTLTPAEPYEYHAGVFWANDNGSGTFDGAWTHIRRGKLYLARAFTAAGSARILLNRDVVGKTVQDIGVAGALGIKDSAAAYETSFNLVE